MTQIEEKLYLQKVFDAIDEVYNLHNHKKTSTYEERLRASFNKLTVPDWDNPDYTCINSLRKAKSHGQVPRTKRFDTKTDNDASISTSNNSCNLSNGSNRHRSTSQSWSERPPIRHNSTASSCDANGSTFINGRHLGNSHDTSTYTSGLQRVVQSSTWYKPKALADNKVNGSTTNGHSIEPPKPPPRYSKLNQEHINSTESSDLSSTSKIINSDLVSNGNIRYSIEQRTMSQIPISTEQNDNESSSLNTSLDVSSDGNLTIIQKLTPSRPIDLSSNPSNIINTPHSNKTINQLFTTNMIRTDSTKSISSDSESKTSTVVPASASSDKNLLGTDSSSYVSVNDQCVSTSSYHTAVATDDTSSLSMNGYETPTPKLDNEILSSHSSTTDLSHVETSESHIEADLAIAAISKEEQKPAIIPSVNVGMEKSPLSLLSSTSSNTPTSSLNDNSPSTESRPLENTNWYDDGSIETCIDQTPAPFSSAELRELSHDEILHGVDLNGVGDEFFLFSPRNTSTNSSLYQSGSYSHPYDNLTSPSSYTSKIRHRHICVGSYYDNKTTTVAIHPNHTLYILGSAPVSPLSRTSASETHYHSPISYGNLTFNALRRVNPFLETNTMLSNYDYQRSPSLYRDDYQRTTYYQPITPIQSTIQTAAESSLPPLFSTPLETQTSSRTVEQYEVPHIPSETVPTTAVSSESQFFTSLSQSEVPLMRPKTSRGRTSEIPPPPLVPPPPPPAAPAPAPRIASIEKDQTQRSSQESDVSSTINDDLQFIRGTIDRVFDHHGGSSTSESSTLYEEISEDNNDDNHLLSSSSSTKTLSKNNDQYPAVEAVQRFYDTKASSDSEKKNPIKQNVDLRDVPISNHSSASNKLYARSHPRNTKKKNFSNSTDNEQASSEEVDDTLNDIEDDDYQDDKLRRQATNNSSHTSSEESPENSSNSQAKTKKASQETQTLQRKEKYTVTTQSQSGSQTTLQSYETARSSVPPIDIVTQMVIERTDDIDDGRIGEISGDMVIFYDDIEIVENSSNISTTESDSVSSISKSQSNSKSYELVPPPVPARALKPVHLLDNQKAPSSTKQNKTNSAPPPAQPIPAPLQTPSSSKVNRVYELEKAGIRKKFDVNSVNTMINRADYYMGPIATHRHPSARHFVGKLNNDETSARNSIDASTNIIAKSSPPSQPTTNMVKSKTLPLQAVNTNGYVVNNNQPTTPTRTSLLNSHMLTTFPSDINVKHRSVVSDTNELVKQIRNSLSRTSLHDTNLSSPLSLSTKDLRTFVSSTYSPNDENMIDNDGIIHKRHQSIIDDDDDQGFKRQARLSKSFHNVSEYSSIDQYPKKDNTFTPRAQPSKSVENNLNQVPQTQKRHSQIPANFPSIVPSTSFSALPHSDDNARQLSMKWYTGQVNENSEICFNASHGDSEDLLYTYISTHSHMEMQLLLARLQESSDIRIHAALDDIRSRVVQFDASKSPGDVHTFMRYLESRLRDISNKTLSITQPNHTNDQRRLSNGTTGTNGYHTQKQRPSDATSIKSRTNSILTEDNRDSSSPRQLGRQHLRTSSTKTGGGINGHQHPPPPPRRASQSSVNQENPAVFDDMLNTVLGLPKKGVTNLPATNPSSQSREKPIPLAQTQISTNTTTAMNKSGQDVGKRLFESGIYKDPRLIYDGPRKTEKEEQPLETSV